VLVQIARELIGRCRSLTRTILALDRELQERTSETAPGLLALPGCGALSAAKLLGPIERFQTDAQPARHAGVAARGQLRKAPSAPARPRRESATQLRTAQDRDHPGTRVSTRARLPGPQTSEGKSRREALRCLKRQLARTVYTSLKNEPP